MSAQHHHQKAAIYSEKIKFLIERCEMYSCENASLVNRLQVLKSLIVKCESDCDLLKDKLNFHDSNWSLPEINETLPEYIQNQNSCNDISIKIDDDSNNSTKSGKRRQAKRVESRTAKKQQAANPYLQFCFERQQFLNNNMSQQDKKKALAAEWKALSDQEKQVYVEKFEKSNTS